MPDTRLSFIIPARNEAALIGGTIDALLATIADATATSVETLRLEGTPFEIIVADDGSDDGTAAIVEAYGRSHGVSLTPCHGRTCGAARNAGAMASRGRVLCFVDADTLVPAGAARHILQRHEAEGRCLVLYRLAPREAGVRPWLWWSFWGVARQLPLARAKSLPALMSCDRAHFARYGPFRAAWAIAEEWPLTGAAYRYHRERFLYDRALTARTSSRRMALQRFGYARTFLKWVSVILFPWARASLDDRIRHRPRHGAASS